MRESDPILFAEQSYAVIDLETTGFAGDLGSIVEVGIVHLDPGSEPTVVLDTLVHPARRIPNRLVHGINNRMVRKAPSIDQLRTHIGQLCGGRVLVSHNAGFELRFLDDLVTGPMLCTLALERSLKEEDADLTLGALATQYGVPTSAPAHSAAADAMTAARVFGHQLSQLERRGVRDLESLCPLLTRAAREWARRPLLPAMVGSGDPVGLLPRRRDGDTP